MAVGGGWRGEEGGVRRGRRFFGISFWNPPEEEAENKNV